jgi:hypothetical protein
LRRADRDPQIEPNRNQRVAAGVHARLGRNKPTTDEAIEYLVDLHLDPANTP